MTDLTKRAAEFISDHDPFGDHFSAHDLAQLDPAGGYAEASSCCRGLAPKQECQCHQEAKEASEGVHLGLLDDMEHEAKISADIEYRNSELRIQALGAAISRRDWHAVEQAYAAIRDKFHAHKA